MGLPVVSQDIADLVIRTYLGGYGSFKDETEAAALSGGNNLLMQLMKTGAQAFREPELFLRGGILTYGMLHAQATEDKIQLPSVSLRSGIEVFTNEDDLDTRERVLRSSGNSVLAASIQDRRELEFGTGPDGYFFSRGALDMYLMLYNQAMIEGRVANQSDIVRQYYSAQKQPVLEEVLLVLADDLHEKMGDEFLVVNQGDEYVLVKRDMDAQPWYAVISSDDGSLAIHHKGVHLLKVVRESLDRYHQLSRKEIPGIVYKEGREELFFRPEILGLKMDLMIAAGDNGRFDIADLANLYSVCAPILKPSPSVDIFRSIAGRQYSDVLSLGCGSGWDEIALAQQGYHVLASDISQPHLDRIDQLNRLHLHIQGLRTALFSATAPEVQDGSLDAIYARLVYHLFDNEGQARFVEECYSKLRPGGLLFVGVPSTRDEWCLASGGTRREDGMIDANPFPGKKPFLRNFETEEGLRQDFRHFRGLKVWQREEQRYDDPYITNLIYLVGHKPA